MSAAKHTPGPWVVTDESFGQLIRGAEIERDDHGTKFLWRDYVGTTWGHRTEESEANARLIAAAPCLLEAASMGHSDSQGLPAGDLLAAANVLRNGGHEDLAARLEAKHLAELSAIAKAEGSTT